jgi:hypothetical protein
VDASRVIQFLPRGFRSFASVTDARLRSGTHASAIRCERRALPLQRRLWLSPPSVGNDVFFELCDLSISPA